MARAEKRKRLEAAQDAASPTASETRDKRRAKRTAGASEHTQSGSPREFTHASVDANARAVTSAISSQVDVDNAFQDAQVHFLTADEASWVYHVPRWYRHVFDVVRKLPAASSSPENKEDKDDNGIDIVRGLSREQWFARIWELHPEKQGTIKMYGRDVLTPRFQQAYDMAIRFSGNTFEAKPLPDELRHCVKAMQAMLMNEQTNQSYLRGALLNWYADGEQYIGPHDDSDKKFFPDSPVFSLSLGATRRFVFTAKTPKSSSLLETDMKEKKKIERLELELQDGDLVVMGGTTQLTHKHALPKMKKCRDKRVSITMRCFKD